MIGTNPYKHNKMKRKYLSARFECILMQFGKIWKLNNGGKYLYTQLYAFNLYLLDIGKNVNRRGYFLWSGR